MKSINYLLNDDVFEDFIKIYIPPSDVEFVREIFSILYYHKCDISDSEIKRHILLELHKSSFNKDLFNNISNDKRILFEFYNKMIEFSYTYSMRINEINSIPLIPVDSKEEILNNSYKNFYTVGYYIEDNLRLTFIVNSTIEIGNIEFSNVMLFFSIINTIKTKENFTYNGSFNLELSPAFLTLGDNPYILIERGINDEYLNQIIKELEKIKESLIEYFETETNLPNLHYNPKKVNSLLKNN